MDFGLFEPHAQAILQLVPAATSLIDARRKRDAAWAAGQMVTAQKHGRKIAEAEATIEACVRQLGSPVARERRRPGVNASVGRVTMDVIKRRRETARLLKAGYSIEEIAHRQGIGYEVARRDSAKIGEDQKYE